MYTYVYRYICEFHLAIVQPCLMDPDDKNRAPGQKVLDLAMVTGLED